MENIIGKMANILKDNGFKENKMAKGKYLTYKEKWFKVFGTMGI